MTDQTTNISQPTAARDKPVTRDGVHSPTSDPKRSTDPQEQRKHQGGRGTADDGKGSQGGEDENGHGDDLKYPN